MKQWIKFFGLSFFLNSVASEAQRRGYRNAFFAAVLAFLLFFAGFICADVVPFSCHYEKANGFGQFVDNAFSNEHIGLTVENGGVKAAFGGQSPSENKLVNTYTDTSVEKIYSLNGYHLIVDTRPATTPIVFSQVGVSDSGEEISYEKYRLLSEKDKQSYTLKTVYTDEEVTVSDENVAHFEEFLADDTQAAESYKVLQEKRNGLTEEQYRIQLYTLYVRFYYEGATSVLTSSEVPVLRDYYYRNYVLELKKDYLYIFGDIVYGSFITDLGVRVNFGGNCSVVPDGEIEDIGEFIKSAFYGTVGYATTSYFLNTMLQLPLIALIPLIIALLVWGAGKIWKCDLLNTFGGSVKTVWAFVWFSALITGLAAFVLGFIVGGTTAYSLMLPVYAGVLAVRSAVYAVIEIIKNRRGTQ